MAIDVSKYKAESSKLIGMLLPYFLHGKRIMKFLAAIASPIDGDNVVFRNWVGEKIIDAVTTAQPIVLKWSLDARLNRYFKNANEHFWIIPYGFAHYLTIYEDEQEFQTTEEAAIWWLPEEDDDVSVTDKTQEIIVRDIGEVKRENDNFTVIAPPQNSRISEKEYVKRIRQVVEYYLTYKATYKVYIRKD